MELHDGANKQVAQNFVTESLNPGQSVTETWHVTAPSTPGTYSLQLGAFSGGWATNYYWDATAGTLTVSTSGGTGDMPEVPFAGIIPLLLAVGGTVLQRRKRH